MKKLVVLFALGVTITGTTYAQNAPQRERRNALDREYRQERRERKEKDTFNRNDERPDRLTAEQRASMRTERLSQRLDLSNKQQKKLLELNLNQARQMESLAGQNNDSKERGPGLRQEKQRLQASWEKEFKSILSKKQYAKYQEEQKQMQAQRGNRGGRGENHGRFRKPAAS